VEGDGFGECEGYGVPDKLKLWDLVSKDVLRGIGEEKKEKTHQKPLPPADSWRSTPPE